MILRNNATPHLQPAALSRLTTMVAEALLRQSSDVGFRECGRAALVEADRRLWAGRAMSLCQDGHTACRTAA